MKDVLESLFQKINRFFR